MATGDKRRKALWFAAAFAVVASALQPGIWDAVLNAMIGVGNTMQVTDWLSPLLDFLGPAVFYLNFGGAVLAGHIRDLYYPQDDTSFVGWAWLIVPALVGSFAQGFAYAWLSLFWRDVWVTRRYRAVAYAVVTVLVVFISYVAGVAHFHKVNCTHGDVGDCDLGFIEGAMWASLALGVSIAVVIVLEALIRRQSSPDRAVQS